MLPETVESQQISGLTELTLEGVIYQLQFVEVAEVEGTNGVMCAVYTVLGYEEVFDIGVGYVPPFEKTPPQLVKDGVRTDEYFYSGEGTLRVSGSDKKSQDYHSDGDPFVVSVYKGDSMQWTAGESGLVFVERCYPPFSEGRFETVMLEI